MTTAPGAPRWSAVVEQPAAVAQLRAALAGDEVAHAWLVVGPAGVGQDELVAAFAAALNCDVASAADEGCGTCSACRRTARGAHPAVHAFPPEGAFHVVGAVREQWIPTATRTATEGRRKVLRVLQAERMNEAAQNAFLKVLEEPPTSVVWFLETHDPAPLLETIRSRCRRLDLAPWGVTALTAAAERAGIAEDLRDVAVRVAAGRPLRLRDFADEDVVAARARHLDVVRRLHEEGARAAVPIAREIVRWSRDRSGVLRTRHAAEFEALEEAYGLEGGRGWPPGVKGRLTRRFERLERQEQRRALELALDDLGAYLRDLVAVASGADDAALVNVDHVAGARRDGALLGPRACVEGLRAIAVCRDALDRNGNPDLQLERVLVGLASALYRRR